MPDCKHCGCDEWYKTERKYKKPFCSSCGADWIPKITEPHNDEYNAFADTLDKILVERNPKNFEWGRFRKHVDGLGIKPKEVNWFGIWARTRLIKHGYHPVGNVTRSSVKSRNGGTERFYSK